MKKKWFIWIITAILLLIIVPVFINLTQESEERTLTGVSLSQLSYQEVTFMNDQEGLELAGMLFLPDHEGPHSAVVIIHGSGDSHRDNKWYLTLTSHLQQNDIAVLLPDKRGSESSEGDWKTASLEELATDTLAGVAFLENQDIFEVSSIGVVGLSQGGMIAPVTATLDPGVDYLVNVVGGAVPMHQGLVYEENHNLREMGFLPGISNLFAYPAAWSLIYFRQTDFWSAVGNFDPLAYWELVEVPALVLYGAEDTNVPSRRSARRLQSLNKDLIQIVIYPGSGHALESPPGEGQSIFREEALVEIFSFITAIGDDR